MDGIMAVIGILLSIGLTLWLAPYVQQWLSVHATAMPNRELNRWEQLYYTLVTAIADFPYAICRIIHTELWHHSCNSWILTSIIFRRRHSGDEQAAPKGFLAG